MRPTHILLLLLAILLSASLLHSPARAASTGPVYVIDLHGYVWPIQADFVTRNLEEAAKNGASAVILDIDTYGGELDSADVMQKSIFSHEKDFPIVAFVHNKALSSGALVTLSCKYIAMTPAATVGSALPHPGFGNSPDTELLQAIQNRFRSMAEKAGRNPNIAEAMVTAKAAIPSANVKEGEILSLTTKLAQANGYCDVVASDYPEILSFLKLAGSPVETRTMSTGEEMAMVITNPWLTVLLLGIGIALIAMELLTFHTHGLLAIIGGLLLAAVFVAHIVAGAATVTGLLLFLAGVALFFVETHLFPGHGLSAAAGLVLIFAGMFFALGGTHSNAIFSLTGAVLVTFGSLAAFFMYLPRSRVWRKIGQNSQQRASEGYVSSQDYTGYIGATGIAVTLLRPSGTAEVNGERLSVVSEGDFVQPGARVEVTFVAGNRIVVREIDAATGAPPA
ncbi:MAG TPA: NfeD family protein [Capsulimonadaceae bacterium]|jgi:membrane-bound serine protease (ClpP class)